MVGARAKVRDDLPRVSDKGREGIALDHDAWKPATWHSKYRGAALAEDLDLEVLHQHIIPLADLSGPEATTGSRQIPTLPTRGTVVRSRELRADDDPSGALDQQPLRSPWPLQKGC